MSEQGNIRLYDRIHELAMMDDEQTAVVGRFLKEFEARFQLFEMSEMQRGTKPGAMSLGTATGAMILGLGVCMALAKEGREAAVADKLRDIADRILKGFVETTPLAKAEQRRQMAEGDR